MKKFVYVVCLCLLTAAAFARSPQEIKSDIAAKRQAIQTARSARADVADLKFQLAALTNELAALNTRKAPARLDDGGETCESAVAVPAVPYFDSGLLDENSVNDLPTGTDDYSCGCDGVEHVYSLVIGPNGLLPGRYTLSTCGSSFDTILSLWFGCPGLEGSTLVDCNDDAEFNVSGDEYLYACSDDFGYSSCITVDLTQNGTYYIVIDGYCSSLGTYFLNIGQGESCLALASGCTEAAPNSYCNTASAIEFNVDGWDFVYGNTHDGAFYTDDAACESPVASCAVWYAVTGTGSWMSASTCSELTDFDTKLHVYRGNCGELQCVTANDDWGGYYDNDGVYHEYCPEYDLASYVEWCSEVGVTYYILVNGYNAQFGNFGLNVHDSDVPCVNCDQRDYYFTVDEVPFCQCLTICPNQIQKIFVGPASPEQRPVATWADGCSVARTIPPSGCESDCSPAYPYLYMDWIYLPDQQLWCMDLGSIDGGCYCFCVDRLLPVELNNFSATAGDGQVQLAWSTASETNADRFEVTRDGLTQTQISAENSATGANYSWTDNNVVNGTAYTYTLVLVNQDGSRQTLATETAAPIAGAALITTYSLAQNYPNPFNPTTAITFSLPEVVDVKLTVVNALGQEVAVLANGLMNAGQHTVNFDGTNLPSGLYFYSLRAGSFSAHQKMVLLK